MTDAAVVTERLERTFGETVAVAGVDLIVQKGEIYGFLGPNGAGKSTLLRVLCTLLLPTAGRALVGGHDVAGEPDRVRLGIGVALQEAALDDRQTGSSCCASRAASTGSGAPTSSAASSSCARSSTSATRSTTASVPTRAA